MTIIRGWEYLDDVLCTNRLVGFRCVLATPFFFESFEFLEIASKSLTRSIENKNCQSSRV